MTLKEKVELLDIYHRLRSAAVVAYYFKRNESSLRTIVKKRKLNFEAIAAAYTSKHENLALFVRYLFFLYENAAFM